VSNRTTSIQIDDYNILLCFHRHLVYCITFTFESFDIEILRRERSLFLDNPVRTVRPVLVTRPNQVPTIILLLLYYTVCLYFILHVLVLSWFYCAEAAAEYNESSRDFEKSKTRKNSRFSIETATHISLNAMIIFCATTWFRNSTNVMFDNTFFTLLSNARIVISNH